MSSPSNVSDAIQGQRNLRKDISKAPRNPVDLKTIGFASTGSLTALQPHEAEIGTYDSTNRKYRRRAYIWPPTVSVAKSIFSDIYTARGPNRPNTTRNPYHVAITAERLSPVLDTEAPWVSCGGKFGSDHHCIDSSKSFYTVSRPSEHAESITQANCA